MNKKIKSLLLTSLSLAVVSAAGVGAATVNEVSASAQEATTVVSRINGASARVASADDSGLRFKAEIDRVQYNALAAENDVVVGMIIVPADYVTAAGGYTHEALIEEYTEDGIIDVSYTEEEIGDYEVYAASIVNIKDANYTRDFVGIAYVKVGETYSYAAYDEENHSRSVFEVASKAYNDRNEEGESKYTADQLGYMENYMNGVADVKNEDGVLSIANNTEYYTSPFRVEEGEDEYLIKGGIVKGVFYNGERKVVKTGESFVADGITVNVPVPQATMEKKTVVLEAGSSYELTDYPVTLPTTDCNFFLTEMYIGSNSKFTMKVTDTTDAENYFVLSFVLVNQSLTYTYQKAGSTASEPYTGTVAIGSGVGSGGTLTDTFNGRTIQLVYNGASGTIGWFNVPDSFVSLDGFTAGKVVVSFTSNVDNTIGLRYFGDTLDWIKPAPEASLSGKILSLPAGSTYTFASIPFALPTTNCNFFLAEMHISGSATITMRVTDAANANNYFDLTMVISGNTITTLTYQKAGGSPVVNTNCGGVLGSAHLLTGYVLQIEYKGADQTIGRFNNADSFISVDGFTAENVVLSFTSDTDVNIGFAWFGDANNRF